MRIQTLYVTDRSAKRAENTARNLLKAEAARFGMRMEEVRYGDGLYWGYPVGGHTEKPPCQWAFRYYLAPR